MKKSLDIAIAAASFICLLSFVSCQKEIKTNNQTELDSKANHGNKAFKHCDIDSIAFVFIVNTFSRFKYNDHGDPLTITPQYVGTGRPLQEFRYDKKHRLTDYIGLYNGGGFEFWYQYSYDKHNRIARDTYYVFGPYGVRPTTASYITAADYLYDSQDRIIKITRTLIKPSGPGQFTNEYSYDSEGNLIMEGAVYDNKVNIHRTNKIWMFIDRDYSMNNRLPVSSYNSFGLPTSYPSWFVFAYTPMEQGTIFYNCNGKGHKDKSEEEDEDESNQSPES